MKSMLQILEFTCHSDLQVSNHILDACDVLNIEVELHHGYFPTNHNSIYTIVHDGEVSMVT